MAGLRFGTRGRVLASVGTGACSCTSCYLPLALFRTMHGLLIACELQVVVTSIVTGAYCRGWGSGVWYRG